MSNKEQLCVVCGKYISYPNEDLVKLKGDLAGNAHLVCAWETKEEK